MSSSYSNKDFRHVILTIVLFIASLHVAISEVTRPKHKVLLVSMDGFRYDYMDKTDTPNMDRMVREGVTMPYMNNTFITLTFPTHYTMATGLYTESHGIISNKMYDPVFNETFDKSDDSKWWSDGEPLWTTVEKAGLRAGVYFWPGSSTENQGIRPTHWLPYKESAMFEIRVDTVVNWLANDEVDLAMLYLHEPDRTGHDYGPDSEQMVLAIHRMDGLVGFLFDQLDQQGIKDTTNVIITSDHGMADVDLHTKVIDLTQYVNSTLLALLADQYVTAHMWAQPGQAVALKDALLGVEHMQVYLREDIPERYHVKNHRRTPDLLAVAELGWTITDDPASLKAWDYKGDHGYDNQLDIMKPFFIARGPDFKVGQSVDPIWNLDLYPLVCHLLAVEPAPNNGSLQRALTLLKDKSAGNGVGGNGLVTRVTYLGYSLDVVFAICVTIYSML